MSDNIRRCAFCGEKPKDCMEPAFTAEEREPLEDDVNAWLRSDECEELIQQFKNSPIYIKHNDSDGYT